MVELSSRSFQNSPLPAHSQLTLCTLMEGNMFWNMVAISLTCMPVEPKLLSTSSGWWVNCCWCILCLFSDETMSLTRVYWETQSKIKIWDVWKKSDHTYTVKRQCNLPASPPHIHTFSSLKYIVGPLGSRANRWRGKDISVTILSLEKVLRVGWQVITVIKHVSELAMMLSWKDIPTYHIDATGSFGEDHEMGHSQWSRNRCKIFQDILLPHLQSNACVPLLHRYRSANIANYASFFPQWISERSLPSDSRRWKAPSHAACQWLVGLHSCRSVRGGTRRSAVPCQSPPPLGGSRLDATSSGFSSSFEANKTDIFLSF